MIKNVLSVASEIFPLVKTGGLADVVGALPGAMAGIGIEMRSLVPGYPAILQAIRSKKEIAELDREFFGAKAQLALGEHDETGMMLYILDAPDLFDRPGNPYLDAEGADWSDNHRRFAALSYAAALLGRGLDKGWRPQIVHGHDWQAGLTPLYCRELCPAAATVFTIHNIAFQGVFPAELIEPLRLPPSDFALMGYEYHGQIGTMKAGLFYADKLTTVSPTYARETQTPEFGMGLEGLLHTRRQDFAGIVNGIDTDIWNPANDDVLSATYDAKSLGKRAVNKTALQRRFALQEDQNSPLFCIVSRLTEQKGMDMVLDSIDHIAQSGAQLALIGTGARAFEEAFIQATTRHPGKIGCIIGYDEVISHQLQGGSDAILVPSRFEPCGLTQLYGLRYGCVPVVSRVGGLADTVIDANDAALEDGVATGIHLGSIDSQGLRQAVDRAVSLYRSNPKWQTIQSRGMTRELGWGKAAKRYQGIYEAAFAAKSIT